MLRNRLGRKRAGAILPLVAISLIALIALVALAIDIGVIALARNQCQNAADAAAMAGARELNGDTTINNNYDAATPKAKAIAATNRILGTAVDPTNVSVTIGYYTYDSTAGKFTPNLSGTKPATENWSACQASVTGSNSTFFARVMNINSFTAGATATAVHRPRDISLILDFSGSMKFASEPAYPSNGDITGSLNPDPAFPKFGPWSSLSSVMQRTTLFVDSGGETHAPNNLTYDGQNGPAVVRDFLYRDSSNNLNNAFYRVLSPYDAMTWACPAPQDWDVQSDTTQTYVGDKWPGKNKNVSNGYAATVQEYLTGSNTAQISTHTKSAVTGGGTGTFDPVSHNAPTTQEGYGPNFKGYSMGPGYYGKTFYIWPPDPRWHPTNTALQFDWRKKFFCDNGTTTPLGGNSTSGDNRVDNTKLFDTSGFWRPANSASSYSINYTAILEWIKAGPQVLPPNLRAGRVLYYSSIPTSIPSSGLSQDQLFWKSYIDYVIGAGTTTVQKQTLYGRNAGAWGSMKVTAKSSLAADGSNGPFMHYNDNPVPPRLHLWFGPLSMVIFLGDNNSSSFSRNWLPGTCHEAQCWQLKAGISSALADIQKNHPNDWVSLLYFSGLQGYSTPRVTLGRDYPRMKNALFYPFSLLDNLGDQYAEIRPYNSSLGDASQAVIPNAQGSTAPEGGFMMAYNQFSTATGFSGRKGAAKMIIFETDGVPNTPCTATFNNGGAYNSSYTGLTFGSNMGNNNSTVTSRALAAVSQVCALDTANPPGYSTQKNPLRVHAIAFGDLFQSGSATQTNALDFLLQVQKRGNTSASTATSIESYKIITGDFATRIDNLREAMERIMQSGIQVTLIR